MRPLFPYVMPLHGLNLSEPRLGQAIKDYVSAASPKIRIGSVRTEVSSGNSQSVRKVAVLAASGFDGSKTTGSVCPTAKGTGRPVSD